MTTTGAVVSHRASGPDRLALQFQSERAAIGPGQSALRTFLELHRVDERRIYQAELVFEEMFSNTVKYGYDDRLGHQIAVTVELLAATIALTFDDDGHGFDPTAWETRELPASIDTAPVGGLGITLVRKIASSIDYQRLNGRNVLRVSIPRA